MKEFASIKEFVEFLRTRPEAVHYAQREGAHDAGALLVRAAQDTIGEYQEGSGPFHDWPKLAEATLEGGVSPSGHHYLGKIELGYAPPDNPLLRTGQLRGSIEDDTSDSEIILGSHDPVAVDHEFGTEYMPPRPFIGLTMSRHGHEAAELVYCYVMAAFCGEPHPKASRFI